MVHPSHRRGVSFAPLLATMTTAEPSFFPPEPLVSNILNPANAATSSWALILTTDSDLQGLEDAINGGLTFALVLNPIACGVTFLTLLFAIWFAWRQKRVAALLGVIFGVISAVLATIAFVIDITIMTVAKKNVEKLSDNFSVTYEQTTWMTLVAMILLWIAVIIFCITGLSWINVDWASAESRFKRTFYTTTEDGQSRPPTVQSFFTWLFNFVMADFQPRASFLAGLLLGLR
ncbi:2850_t:CDS:2, partial [Acaulospora colombiana]